MKCVFEQIDVTHDDLGIYACIACVERKVTSRFPASQIHRQCRCSGPGDWLSAYLTNLGITPLWYLKWKARVYRLLGLALPKRCGCESRQEQINKLYFSWRRYLIRFFVRS